MFLPRARLLPALLLLPASGWAAAPTSGEELFVRRIQPLLEERCLACHGRDEVKIKSGFDLRTREALLRGGDSGEPGLQPGDPAHSPLFLSVQRTDHDWKSMPPKENDRLSLEQIAAFRDWIAAGAPWPDARRAAEVAAMRREAWSAEDGMAVPTTGPLSETWATRRYQPAALWAFQPVRQPAVPPGGRHPIDALLEADFPTGLQAAPPADRGTLLRRATFDLVGLPPTPEETDAFLHDPAPDAEAFARVVERLLASPHYGEQWGRHWLDVVRYADSAGLANDYERGSAWRYRDYVVRAFNADKPYDQFILEQLAGDELLSSPGEAGAGAARRSELLIATGFLRMGPWELTSMEVPRIARQRFLDDVTNSVGETFLAQSLQCARCHDHKFDPIPTHDYYAVQACFAATQLTECPAPFLSEENQAGFSERALVESRQQGYEETLHTLDERQLHSAEAWLQEHPAGLPRWQAALQAVQLSLQQHPARRAKSGLFDLTRNRLLAQGVPEAEIPPRFAGFTTVDFGQERVARKGLERLAWELDRYEPIALAVYDGPTPEFRAVTAPVRPPAVIPPEALPEPSSILAGGDPFSPVRPVTPAPLSALGWFNPALPPASGFPSGISGRRLALARWIAAPENPLTTRAIVNRLWLWHFGQALAGNPNNFGATGKRPLHSALLDWLAATLVERGWSFKAMHRLIMSSEAYRRSAEFPFGAAVPPPRDVAEAAGAVFRPRRLEAEELRDTTLQLTGELNPAPGGIPCRPEINPEAALQPRQVMGTFAAAWVPNARPEDRHRRSLYALHLRGLRDPFLEVFNAPAPDFSCERREVSTITPQVFAFFNSAGSAARALALAARVSRTSHSPEEAVRTLFSLCFQRAPAPEELTACLHRWTAAQRDLPPAPPVSRLPLSVQREAVEENTGEKFAFTEPLTGAADFIPDLQPSQVDASTRALAEVCLVLLNTNEFIYVY